MTPEAPDATPDRKPRVALMGEFSAGKSTLANLLLEQDSSPVRATATQLPPVWYSLGVPAAERIARDGSSAPLPLDDWGLARPEHTRMISVKLEADVLQACDLIDMPGTSDPNMVPDFWQDILHQVDLVIWCTPANQAWRQSEAALWEQVPTHLWTKSLLLVTRMDKVKTDSDRARVLSRVRSEAGTLFREVLPIALPIALADPDDAVALEKSGATALVRFLCDALETGGPEPGRLTASDRASVAPSEALDPAPQSAVAPEASPADGRIVPRRVRRKAAAIGRARNEARP